MKIIFVASDFSGLGKGTFAASIGRVFKSCDVNVRIMKCDLYFNYDAGTINPGEHGEVYVMSDGTETDQDLGIYERFIGIEANTKDYVTSGRIFHQIFLNERAGRYLGKTVSVEHVIDEIKERMKLFANQCEVGIIELGATIGDIKGIYFLEACRQLIAELGKNQSQFVLLSHFPYLENVKELKTMGCQRSVSELRNKGIKPDVIIARTSKSDEIPDYHLNKIRLFCEVPKEAIFPIPDLDDEYKLPKFIKSKAIHKFISTKLELNLDEDRLDEWYSQLFNENNDLKIAIVGKYSHGDAYVSIMHQLRFLGVRHVVFISEAKDIETFDAVIIPGGWGSRGIENIIQAIQICRENNIPCLGICLGLQLMVIEYTRNVLGLENSNSMEFNPETPFPVVILQEEQKLKCNVGGTARLGNWTTLLEEKSKLSELYGKCEIIQRHRHRYEISPDFDYKDFRIVGKDKNTHLIEAMELLNHSFYIGVQFHPEFSIEKSPIFRGLIDAAIRRRKDLCSEQIDSITDIFIGDQDTFFENINLSDESKLDIILSMSAEERKKNGIGLEEYSILSDIVETIKEKKDIMSKIEGEIMNIHFEIRQINLHESRIEGRQLTKSEQDYISNLQNKINEKQETLKRFRESFQNQFLKFDFQLGKIRKSRNIYA